VTIIDTWDKGRTFPSTIPFGKLSRLIGASEVAGARTSGRLSETPDGTGFVLREPIPPSDGNIAAQKLTAAQGSSRM
jgi:hypothetical protein